MSVFDQSFHNKNLPGCLGFCRDPSHQFSASGYANGTRDKHLLTGEDQQKKEEIDTILSEAINNLSFEERQAQQEELHGVADELAEEASLIENSLRELRFHLSQTNKSGRAYELAERTNPRYVQARSFQISFLRADRYNAQAAADRILRFFDEKQKLFGAEKLTKDITITDLDQDDIAAFKTGCIQWAGWDRSDRPILLHVPGLRKFKDLKNELRASYFLMMEAIKSPETQLRGIVVLNYTIGHFKDSRKGYGWKDHARLAEAIPIYPGAYHFACDDLKQYLFMNLGISLSATDFRVRFRLHFGTHLECQYLLSSYGIPVTLLPFSPEINYIDLEPHLRWCERYIKSNDDGTKGPLRKVPMPRSSSTKAITEPNPNDVLSAGSTKMCNIGNERLRVLVKDSLEAYRSGSSDEKRRIVDSIVNEIQGAGGRFLRQEKQTQTWKELSLSKARLKINQRFRNHNRRRDTAYQQALEGTPISDMACPDDVIFGKVVRTRGTTLLHQLVKDRSEEYEGSDRTMKVVVVESIIARIKSEGGRFLQPSISRKNHHVEVSTDSVRDRIATYFRNQRRSTKNK